MPKVSGVLDLMAKFPRKTVNRFSDLSVRIPVSVLCCLGTLSCGAVGNPTMEEQALARIHRLGQTREVETVRFYVQVYVSTPSEWTKRQKQTQTINGIIVPM
ncbi:hypothetical protein F4808DRAFT_420895 [Astrocystis sublimbata]|nr:hypothetical protein F4808DRAFT_420895 [Astrocystis sublimbata]